MDLRRPLILALNCQGREQRQACSNGCGWSVYLDNASDVLHPCGRCRRGQQVKYCRC